MKATIENLKANREEIMNNLTNLFGSEKLKSAMLILKDKVEYAEMFEPTSTVESFIEEIRTSGIFETSRRKTSKLAEMQGAWMESKGYTKFNNLTKNFE